MSAQAILAAAQAGLSMVGEMANIRAEDSARANTAAEVNRSAVQGAANAFLQEFEKLKQVNQQEFERKRAALRERASIRAAQGDAGVSGNSAIRAISASFINEQLDLGTLEGNETSIKDQTNRVVGHIGADQRAKISQLRSGSQNNFMRVFRVTAAGLSGAGG